VRQSQSTLGKGVNVKVILYLLQEECYVPIIREENLGITGPESIRGYTRMIILIYNPRLIY
jgi:hypothetical protein